MIFRKVARVLFHKINETEHHEKKNGNKGVELQKFPRKISAKDHALLLRRAKRMDCDFTYSRNDTEGGYRIRQRISMKVRSDIITGGRTNVTSGGATKREANC